MRPRHWSILAAVLTASALAAGCGGSDNPTKPGGGGGANVTINITGQNGTSSYNPSPDTVAVGQTVAWHNNNGTTHTATFVGTGGFNTSGVAPGSSSGAIQMNTAGSYTYHCTIHPAMTGTLVVKP